MARHRYGISALVSQTSFRAKTSGGVAEWQLFSQATEVQIETLQADCLNKHSHLLLENLKHRKAGSLPGHSIRHLCPNLLLFMSFSFMGDVAADLFPFGFAGVSSNRLAPVFVHTVTMETGELSVVLLLPWEHSLWGVLGGVSRGLALGSSAFCCCSNNLICNVKGTLRRSKALF